MHSLCFHFQFPSIPRYISRIFNQQLSHQPIYICISVCYICLTLVYWTSFPVFLLFLKKLDEEQEPRGESHFQQLLQRESNFSYANLFVIFTP